ncbi:hypothetical protein HII28_19205 [Planctomonas sp. JC2975]|uniref:hypothetical protein n=1 Tax=Planctomonas sp. JC2975 TaxID=2729626 RepID=UPI0014756646|nr:hypothetical protein [Planctomonas sp. JC2975]NNC13995.1 hypothetical protein [Planctomonas sp. JC2975]
MSAHLGEDVVLSDDSATRRSRFYRWLVDHLAKFPGRVTLVTFAAGVVVAVIVSVVGGDESLVTVAGLVATLWALFFAVMIYLLTARDTDKVLDEISELREQLAEALASPDEEDLSGQTDAAPSAPAPAPDTPEVSTGGELDRPRAGAGDGTTRPAREPGFAGQPRPHDRGVPRIADGATQIMEAVPSDLIQTWASATGLTVDDLARAWSRDPRAEKQWVLETPNGERWVVFNRGASRNGVISLTDARHGRRGPRR